MAEETNATSVVPASPDPNNKPAESVDGSKLADATVDEGHAKPSVGGKTIMIQVDLDVSDRYG